MENSLQKKIKKRILFGSIMLLIDWSLILSDAVRFTYFDTDYGGLLFILFVMLSILWVPALCFAYFLFQNRSIKIDNFLFTSQEMKDSFLSLLGSSITAFTVLCNMVFICIFMMMVVEVCLEF